MTSRVLRWTGALGIAAVAIVRCVIVFAPQLVFDVDPVIDPTPLPGLGPAGSLFLDAVASALLLQSRHTLDSLVRPSFGAASVQLVDDSSSKVRNYLTFIVKYFIPKIHGHSSTDQQ